MTRVDFRWSFTWKSCCIPCCGNYPW